MPTDNPSFGRLLRGFVIPASTQVVLMNPILADPKAVRMKMTVRVSYDDCKTWTVGKTLYPGPAAYSDVTVAPDGTILCMYERGLKFFCDNLTLAKFDIEWLTAAPDGTTGSR